VKKATCGFLVRSAAGTWLHPSTKYEDVYEHIPDRWSEECEGWPLGYTAKMERLSSNKIIQQLRHVVCSIRILKYEVIFMSMYQISGAKSVRGGR
jgi:hypothetical protein